MQATRSALPLTGDVTVTSHAEVVHWSVKDGRCRRLAPVWVSQTNSAEVRSSAQPNPSRLQTSDV